MIKARPHMCIERYTAVASFQHFQTSCGIHSASSCGATPSPRAAARAIHRTPKYGLAATPPPADEEADADEDEDGDD